MRQRAAVIDKREVPPQALLQRYVAGGAYTDCFAAQVPGRIAFATYVEAFYTTWLFKLERVVLALIGRPSTDAQARELAHGAREQFAAWSVEARGDDQLLLCDFQGRTRSWLMVAPAAADAVPATRLYFGSAVVPGRDRRPGQRLGQPYDALLAFHKAYSVALLRAAQARVLRMTRGRAD